MHGPRICARGVLDHRLIHASMRPRRVGLGYHTARSASKRHRRSFNEVETQRHGYKLTNLAATFIRANFNEAEALRPWMRSLL